MIRGPPPKVVHDIQAASRTVLAVVGELARLQFAPSEKEKQAV